MGADIIITEVDEPKTLTDLDELKTPKVGGGYEYWVRKSKTRLTTKSISKNGTYNASSDDAYGYSKVTVNVPGGNGSADSHGKPNTSPGAPKPGGSGSAVVGKDTTTGNEQVVGVDESGNLVTTPLPSSIVIVTNPTKMSYSDGETIDLTGAVVVAKNADETTWTNADYPNGHIPIGEIACDPSVAQGGDSGETWGDGDGIVARLFSAISSYIETYSDSSLFIDGNGEQLWASRPHGYGAPQTIFLTQYAGRIYARFATNGQVSVKLPKMNGGDATPVDYSSFSAIVSTDVYGEEGAPYIKSLIPLSAKSPEGYSGEMHKESSGSEISLSWARPVDGKALSTKLTITVGVANVENGSGGGGSF